MKKIIVLFLALVLSLSVFSASGCSCSDESNDGYDVWTVSAEHKILREGSYEEEKKTNDLAVGAARNEYEGWQIIISGNEDSEEIEYDITLSNLTNANGDEYSAENIKLYNQCYIYAYSVEYYKIEGEYPDALVPFSNAKDANENVVLPNKNSGVYVEFYVPENQASGVYTGSFTVTLGEETVQVPVTLDVYNYTISSKTTARSFMGIGWSFYYGELDTTQEMFEKYIDYLLEYRLTAGDLLYENTHSDEDVAKFAELAAKYAADENYTTIRLPKRTVSVSGVTQLYGGEYIDIVGTYDQDLFEKYVLALAKKSAETGVNILDKCIFYMLDEPQLYGISTMARVIYDSNNFVIQKQKLADTVLNDTSLLEDKITRQEIATAILGIDNLITTPFEDEYADCAIDYCPTVDWYDGEGQREQYEGSDRWWYCCTAPHNPYPTYHLDDSLLGTRILYWMASEYNVTGNLNWAANAYGTAGYLEDYFATAARSHGQNGEGFIMYPGQKYGIDGPIGSLRLQAYRDGVEDYEVLEAIKNKFKDLSQKSGLNLDYAKMFNYLTASLYSGTKWNTTESTFYKQKENLTKFAELALSSQTDSAILTDYEKLGSSYKLGVFTTGNAKVYLNGQLQNPTQTYEAGALYNLNVDISNYDGNEIVLKLEAGDVSNEFSFEVGGKATSVSAQTISENLTVLTDQVYKGVESSLIDANGVGEFTDGKVVKLAITKGEQTKPSVDMTGAILGDITTKNEIQFVIYSDSEIDAEVYFKYLKGTVAMQRVSTAKLKVGINYLTVSNLNAFKWDTYKGIDKFRLLFKPQANANVYVKEIIVTEK